MRFVFAILVFGLVISTFASEADTISLGEAAERAVQQSKLTAAGCKPFHLKAEIVETTNPSSEYRANVEEYWVSPQKWRRTIDAPGFSQVLVVNGEKVSERDTGEYFPWWLNDLVTAMVDPLPMAEVLRQANAQIQKPQGSGNSETCADLRTKVDRWTFCFEGSYGLLTSAVARGYAAEFEDYRNFGDKRVAYRLHMDPEPGTTIQASIAQLSELAPTDEAMFLIQQPTPLHEQIRSVQLDEDALRKLSANGTEIKWPSVGGGLTTGRCAVYISADRSGRIREVWPQGCDNPGLEDPLRDTVKKWQLKPAIANGVPVQVECLLTFAFRTKIAK